MLVSTPLAVVANERREPPWVRRRLVADAHILGFKRIVVFVQAGGVWGRRGLRLPQCGNFPVAGNKSTRRFALTPDELFGWLASAPCGAFAVSLDQTIVFWNGGPRSILGYSACRVVGRKCYEVMAGAADSGLTPDCAGECASVRYARVGMVPAPTNMMMRCASGARKLLRVQPMVVSGVDDTGPLIVYLFGDAAEESSVGAAVWAVTQESSGGPLTEREIGVLRYLALGWDTAHIAAELGLSPHTVRNHSTNLRRKLDVRSSLEAVMAAVRLGLLTFDGGRPETDGS